MHPTALALCALLFFSLPGLALARIHYQLEIQLTPQTQVLTGKIQVQSDTDESLQLRLPTLQALTVNGAPEKIEQQQLSLTLVAQVPVQLTYQALIHSDADNLITPNSVFLMENWYPLPERPVHYQFSALLPADFVANSEADQIQVSSQGNQRLFAFDFPYPLERLTLTASNQYQRASENYQGIQIETYFFKEDQALSQTYLDYSKSYLDLYAERLSPYPFKRFAIVMHQQPTGWSLPTYTLLGQQVARLPFIVKTSLGHEILHQWFGNLVWIDYAAGNWAEGLVNYLADHYYAQLAGKGASYRKQIMLDYAAYTDQAPPMSVLDFRTRNSKAQSAVGYGKTALIFHALQQRLGEKKFLTALQELIENQSFQQANWQSLEKIFAQVAQEDLSDFFAQWLERQDIPSLQVENPQVKVAQGQLKLLFSIKQLTEKPYNLSVPLQIDTDLGKQQQILHLDSAEKSFSLPLNALPSQISLDANYDLMRRLDATETPPLLAHLLALAGSKHRVQLILNQAQLEAYQPLLEALGITYQNTAIQDAWRDATQSLIIAGQPLPQLIGAQTPPAQGVMLKVFKHPEQHDQRILWLYAENLEQAQLAAHKIGHYGNYSALHFIHGKRQQLAEKETEIAETQTGIPIWQQPQSAAVQPVQVQALNTILPQLKTAKILYIGEQHDQFAHHINQLTIIRFLHEVGIKVAIGMEMFQQPYQQALDDYLAGKRSEAEFLKESQYFEKWRYDYNLYKPLIDYAKQQGIPLIALNIEGNISRQVGRDGIGQLDDSARAQLPSALDFNNYRYQADLQDIFALHQNANRNPDAAQGTTAAPRFEHFLQAQVLWDDSMAQTAHNFLQKNPQHTLVVLAGNGHIRNGYGIPQRLHQRNGLDYVTLLQDEMPTPGIADYVLYPPPLVGEEAPRLGVFIDDQDRRLRVQEIEPQGVAQAAQVQKNDILVRLDAHEIQNLADLKAALLEIGKGNNALLEVLREGKAVQLELQF